MHETDAQDIFLTNAEKSRTFVTLFLMNGFQMKGIVMGHDGFPVVLESDGRQNLIYKHAISTITPVHPVSLTADLHSDSSN